MVLLVPRHHSIPSAGHSVVPGKRQLRRMPVAPQEHVYIAAIPSRLLPIQHPRYGGLVRLAPLSRLRLPLRSHPQCQQQDQRQTSNHQAIALRHRRSPSSRSTEHRSLAETPQAPHGTARAEHQAAQRKSRDTCARTRWQGQVSEYDGSEDASLGAESRSERRIFLAADQAADLGVAGPRSDDGENGAEPCARRGAGSLSRAGHHDRALRSGGFPVAAEFADDSDGELFCVSLADCAAHSVFPGGRKIVWRTTPAAVRRADFDDGTRQFLGRDAIFMDHNLARGTGVVFDCASVCSAALCDFDTDFAASSKESESRRMSKNLLQDLENFFVAFERRNEIGASKLRARPG